MSRDRPHPPLPDNAAANIEASQLAQHSVSQHQQPSLVAQAGRIQDSSPVPTERPQSPSTGGSEKPLVEDADNHSPSRYPNNDPRRTSRVTTPPPARGGDGHTRASSRRPMPASPTIPGIDWIVPVEQKSPPERTIGERLSPTIEVAEQEKQKYSKKAMMTGYALNVAIGLQVLLGSLTTGLSAVTTGRQVGGSATLVASYLARARGSNEPELSITRVKDLEQFLRDCKTFQMDHGHQYGSSEPSLNQRLIELRGTFEELLGNGNGERKLSPV
ncbi:hypothetical protein BV22DRAFT_1113101 [Leucogyrophana mollusca]|uniref:Uncharacterized protein n=1 Tax=Leucogyrophana mollusca TaxID=85980 RepID=A0ACB8BDN5_9AGAM|nr:hypothetical protein BV22DRAFT_1113101 [Leucogyrophana mollusca]